jgi:predicted phage tail protein
MKHLLKKISFAGGKKSKPKPKPAQLKPPILGTIQLAASYSYAELLDLISDGPIAGLVNQNGLILPSKDILQGIYLDDTAVAVSNDEILQQEPVGESVNFANSQIITNFSNLFQNIQNSEITSIAQPPLNYKTVKSFTRIGAGRFPVVNWGLNENVFTNQTSLTKISDFYYKNNTSGDTVNSWPDSSVSTSSLNINAVTIKTGLNSLFGIYNISTNQYEKKYLENIFDKYLSSSWRLNQATAIDNFAASFDYSRFIYIININDSYIWNAGLNIDSINKQYQMSLFSIADTVIKEQDITFYDLFLPRIDNISGKTTGRGNGLFIVSIKAEKIIATIRQKTTSGRTTFYWDDYYEINSIPQRCVNALSNASKLNLTEIVTATELNSAVQKYNYTNILAEYRSGEEYQTPFKYFNNVLIDKDYSSQLIGPFRTTSSVQRIQENVNMINVATATFTTTNIDTEGSNDNQRNSGASYSDWDKNINTYDEKSIPITHVIINPNVTSVFITIQVDSLLDTLSKDIDTTFTAGVNFASILNLSVETGTIDIKGQEANKVIRKFKILALIQSPTFIDIGNPDLNNFSSKDYKFISEYDSSSTSSIFQPFELEQATDDKSKRYIRVSKISAETNSSLLQKNCSLAKVTEIIPQNFNYPNSAIIGTKLDSRTFGSIPTRTYDCKLKKVRVPTNYYPLLSNGKDKRYYSSENVFNESQKIDTLIYDGDWDGAFKDQLEWTDNPAWVLLDLITNERYGLGQYMDDSQIDIFDLYKIARFCDAVDDFGYFQGVPDGQGGLEPRFSCNILFAEGIKVFDALNTIAALFRGIIYYNNSQINFVDDRPKDPMALFSNTNVKDGFFSYSNYRRDEQFNSIEVIYIDRFENYLTKVEYVEDEEDIRKRGIFKKTINANGVTSRAMARRLGQHLIFQTIQENQSISFSTGLEALFCKPGDLIIVEDELKNLKSNFGKVLSVNPTTKSIRLNEKFISGEFADKLTVYTPTGYSTNDDLLEIANLIRFRVRDGGFYLNSGNLPVGDYPYLTGNYTFSGYIDGYIGEVDFLKQNQYAFYTGTNSKFCYYSTGFTGWVLGTGIPFSDNNTYSKIIFGANDLTFTQVNTGKYNTYNTSSGDRRSGIATNTNLVGQTTGINSLFKDVSGSLQTTRGLLDSDIVSNTPSQITTFDLSGIVQYDYGCEVFVDSSDINYSLVPFVKEGSVYRFQRILSDDQLYKVISIKEDNINEYSIVATKFDTGKYALIENDKSIEYQSNTYSYTVSQKVGDTNYQVLSAPSIQQLTTGLDSFGSFYISGKWKNVLNNKGYNANIKNSQGMVETQVLPINETGALFYVDGIGNYSFRVNAIGSVPDPTRNNTNFYTDSDYSQSGIFIIYEEGNLLNYDRPFLSSVTIL